MPSDKIKQPITREAFRAAIKAMKAVPAHFGLFGYAKQAMHFEETIFLYRRMCKLIGEDPLSIEELQERSSRSMRSLVQTIEDAECEARRRFQSGKYQGKQK